MAESAKIQQYKTRELQPSGMNKKFIISVLLGWVFAAVVETINMGIGQGLWLGMALTVIFFYGSFSVMGYWFSVKKSDPIWLHFVLFGFIGLMFEWIIFGMVPWGGGNVFVIILNQTGMFSHWATVTFAPRLLLDKSGHLKKFQRNFLIFYIIGMTLVYVIGFLSPSDARFTIMILGNVLVYSALIGWYVRYFRLSKPQNPLDF